MGKSGVPDKTWRSEWETKLRKTGRNCWISGNPAPRLSLAVNPDEGVVSAIQAYILEGALRVGDPWNTVEKYAYHLCIWYDYLRYKGIEVFDADERHLRNFLLGGATRYSNVSSINKNIEIAWTASNEERFKAITAFYDFWKRKRGKRLRVFRGGSLADLDLNLFDREGRSAARAKRNFAKPALESALRQKGTPNPEEAEKVLDRVLEQDDENRAQTYYLIGSLAYRSGSRNVGISSLTVPGLLQGLKDERAIRAIPQYRSVLQNLHIEANKVAVIQALQDMKARWRRGFVYVQVRNKGGGKPIPIPVPIELCVEIIDYVCTHRADVVAQRFSKKGKVAPPHVFLSYKPEVAGGFLQTESISNYFREIFRDLDIDGSLHRLRASFCEEVVRDLYIRERAVHGRAWQANNIIEFARTLLGHKNPHSLEYYLNRVLNQELISGDPVLVDDPEDTPFIRAVCEELRGPAGKDFRVKFQAFCQGNALVPITEDERRYALF
ncbi:hypothetical protein ACU8L2_23400 [Rhizobium leguminosarum]